MNRKPSNQKKRASKPGAIQIVRESEAGRFMKVAEQMTQANTASRDIAVGKLKDLGILADDGRLSDKYK